LATVRAIRGVPEEEWVAAVLEAVPVEWASNPQIQAQRFCHAVGSTLLGHDRSSLPTRGPARARFDLSRRLATTIQKVQAAKPWRSPGAQEAEEALSGWELYERRTRGLRMRLTIEEKGDLEADALAVGSAVARTLRLASHLASHVESRSGFDLVWDHMPSPALAWLRQASVDRVHGSCLAHHAVFKDVFENVASRRLAGDPFHEDLERLLHKLDGELAILSAPWHWVRSDDARLAHGCSIAARMMLGFFLRSAQVCRCLAFCCPSVIGSGGQGLWGWVCSTTGVSGLKRSIVGPFSSCAFCLRPLAKVGLTYDLATASPAELGVAIQQLLTNAMPGVHVTASRAGGVQVRVDVEALCEPVAEEAPEVPETEGGDGRSDKDRGKRLFSAVLSNHLADHVRAFGASGSRGEWRHIAFVSGTGHTRFSSSVTAQAPRILEAVGVTRASMVSYSKALRLVLLRVLPLRAAPASGAAAVYAALTDEVVESALCRLGVRLTSRLRVVPLPSQVRRSITADEALALLQTLKGLRFCG